MFVVTWCWWVEVLYFELFIKLGWITSVCVFVVVKHLNTYFHIKSIDNVQYNDDMKFSSLVWDDANKYSAFDGRVLRKHPSWWPHEAGLEDQCVKLLWKPKTLTALHHFGKYLNTHHQHYIVTFTSFKTTAKIDLLPWDNNRSVLHCQVIFDFAERNLRIKTLNQW